MISTIINVNYPYGATHSQMVYEAFAAARVVSAVVGSEHFTQLTFDLP